MAIENRALGKGLSVFSVGSQALVTLVQEANIDFSVSVVDGTCLADTANYNVPNRSDFKISWSLTYDQSAAAITNLIDLVGTLVSFSITTVASGEVYSGSGLLHMGKHNIPNGGQTLDFEIIPQGVALTK